MSSQNQIREYTPREIYNSYYFLLTWIIPKWPYTFAYENSDDIGTVCEYIKAYGHLFRTLYAHEFPKCLLAFIKENYMRQDGVYLDYIVRKDYPDFADYRIIPVHDLSYAHISGLSEHYKTPKEKIKSATFSVASINDIFSDFFAPYFSSGKIPTLSTHSGKPIVTQGVLKELWEDLQKSGDDVYSYFAVEDGKNRITLKQVEALKVLDKAGAGNGAGKDAIGSPLASPKVTETPRENAPLQRVKLKLKVKTREVYWEGEKTDTLPGYPLNFLYALAMRPTVLLHYELLNQFLGEACKERKAISKHINTIIARIPPLKNHIDTTKDAGYTLNLKTEEIEIIGNIGNVDSKLTTFFSREAKNENVMRKQKHKRH